MCQPAPAVPRPMVGPRELDVDLLRAAAGAAARGGRTVGAGGADGTAVRRRRVEVPTLQ